MLARLSRTPHNRSTAHQPRLLGDDNTPTPSAQVGLLRFVADRTPNCPGVSQSVANVEAMGIKGFESRLERMVEGTLSRLFRTGLNPVEFGRKLQREMDGNRKVDLHGRTIVPNHYEFTISPADFDQLADLLDNLRGGLADAAREHTRDESYHFVGQVEIRITADESLRPGILAIRSRFVSNENDTPPGALVLPTGDRVSLGESTVTIGRHNQSTIVLADPNVSRHHAEIRPSADGYAVIDQGSTNGTRVNGDKVTERQLRDGDEVACGNTVMVFEAS